MSKTDKDDILGIMRGVEETGTLSASKKDIKKPHKCDCAVEVEDIGVEPTTSCMPCKRSSQLS